MATITELKQRNSIGRKWLVGEELIINKVLKFHFTDYGEVVVFDATTHNEDGAEVSETVFCGAKAVVDLFKPTTAGDFPIKARLIEKISQNKRTYQDIEDLS